MSKNGSENVTTYFIRQYCTIFYLSGKFDGGDVDVDGDLDVDVQDTLGHFVVHCHQTRPLLVLGNTDGVGRIKLISSAV